MSEQPKENEGEKEPRITYVGNPVSTEPTKQKNPNRVAGSKRQAALHKEKKRLLKEGYTSETDSEGKNNCENSKSYKRCLHCRYFWNSHWSHGCIQMVLH